MSNVIDIFPGRKEIEMKKFRENNFRPGLIDFRAIDPSKETVQNNKKIDISYENNLESDLASLSAALENIENSKKCEKESLTLYNRHGFLYSLYIKGRSQNI